MPPSPSMRCSPRRELQVESKYKRGCSFDTGSPVKTREDDLALFNDMQLRERENFLLHSTDDVEDSLSFVKYFPDFKLNISAQETSSDLLNVESEKDDYDWLLTPPDTPLFPSLDDDELLPVDLDYGSTTPPQPITISRSSIIERNHRTNKGSERPCQVGLSPPPGSGMSQSGGRLSYAPYSSPATSSLPTNPLPPSQRSVSPASKPLTSTLRSSTPTIRRTSTGSSGNISSSTRKGTSPSKASRGNSASPKLRGWQSSLPGFSTDPPPNIRTSLSDRTAYQLRDPSSAYRNRGDSPLRSGRQSLSPTTSRSVSSSQSHDRDNYSCHSKGSVASYGDDDADSTYSVNIGISTSITSRRNRASPNSRSAIFSKKSRTLFTSSAPKRSFDSRIKPMDQHKSRQNMFRPLLSSVPASTFYGGKANTIHHPLFSRNSSLTTSSNASSEFGVSVFDTEGSEHDQHDIAEVWEKMMDADVQEEIFMFEKMDEIADIANEVGPENSQVIHGNFGGNRERIMEPKDLEYLTSDLVDIVVALPTSESLCDLHHSEVDFITIVCSKCNKSFRVSETAHKKNDVCQECTEKAERTSYGTYTVALCETLSHGSHKLYLHPRADVMLTESCEASCIRVDVPEVPEQSSNRSFIDKCRGYEEKSSDRLADTYPTNIVTIEMEQERPLCQPRVVSTSYDGCGSEGTGISVLIKNSNGNSGQIVQGRVISPASVTCAQPSYTRDSMSTLKVSITRSSSSAFSSIDVGSGRQSKSCMQHQSSNSKADPNMAHVRSAPCLSHPSTQSCFFRISNDSCEKLSRTSLLDPGDNLNAIRGAVTWESTLKSSSDLSTSRQTVDCSQRPLSCSKDDHMECAGAGLKAGSAEMFPAGVLCNSQDDLSASHQSQRGETISRSAEVLLHDAHGKSQLITEEHAEYPEKTETCCTNFPSTTAFLPVGNKMDSTESCRILDSSSLLVSGMQNTPLENVSASEALIDECCVPLVYSETHLSHYSRETQEDMATRMPDSRPFEDDGLVNDSTGITQIPEACWHSSSCRAAILEDEHDKLESSQTESEVPQNASNNVESSDADSVSPALEEKMLITGLESDNLDRAHSIHGEPAITAEGPGGDKSRCLTLEGATDTIFCSSIIHGLAFKAAAVGMEKECSPSDDSYQPTQPTPIAVGKSAFDEKHQKMITPGHSTNPPKTRRTMLEVDDNIRDMEPQRNMETTKIRTLNSEVPDEPSSLKPTKLEPKCNCTVM